LKKKNLVATSLILFAFLLGLFVQTVSALGIHYELDKPYYHPGDTGKLLLVCNNDGPSDMAITRVEVKISGVGTFQANLSFILPEVTLGRPGILCYLLKPHQPANIEIPFKIPTDTKPGEYSYTWTIEFSGTAPFSKTETLKVCAVGEEPQPEQTPIPMPLLLIAFPVLLVTYFLLKRTHRKTARALKIATLALLALFMVFGEGWKIIYLAYMLTMIMIGFFPPAGVIIPILIVLSALVAIHRRRRKPRMKTSAPTAFACPRCERDLATLPRDIAICPYCGEKLTRSTCQLCGKDLSQLPADIKNCPHCGVSLLRRVSEAPVVTSVEAREKSQLLSRIFLMGLVAIALSLLLMFVSGMGSGPGPWRPLFPELYAIQTLFFITFLLGIAVATVSGLIIGFRRIKKTRATF